MKRAIALFLSLIMCLSLLPAGAFAEEPTAKTRIISTADELAELSERVNAGDEAAANGSYLLTDDLYLPGAFTPIGTAEHPFKGSFDGDGKKISGLSAAGGTGTFGLFGVTENARLKRIAIEDAAVSADGCTAVGAIVGLMQGGTLTESYVTGTVSSSGITGGLVGVLDGGTVENCYNTAEVKGYDTAGGVVGCARNGALIRCCYGLGYAKTETWNFMGRIAGAQESVTIEDCYAVNGADASAPSLCGDEAQTAEKYIGFDFENIWKMDGYPSLRFNGNAELAVYAETKDAAVSYGALPSDIEMPEYSSGGLSASGIVLPEKYDLRDYGYVTPVRDQNPYGTCYMFATLAAAESNILKKYGASVDLSEVQAIYTYKFGPRKDDGSYNDPLDNFGGDHTINYASTTEDKVGWGNSRLALHLISGWMGVMAEDSLTSYTGSNLNSMAQNGLPYSYCFDKDSYHLKNAYIANINNRSDVKELIMNYGAVTISYMSRDGCYDTNTPYYGKTYYDDGSGRFGEGGGHCVAIIGWDDSFSRYNFRTDCRPENDGAWLIRNSWGSDANDNGYFWMSYESYHESGREECIACEYERSNDYDYCYQYDGGRGIFYETYGLSSIYGANVFTAQHNETLNAISFWSDFQYNVQYDLTIVKNPVSGSPLNGTAVLTQSGYIPQMGYYTVPLSEAIPLNEGESFAIVLRFTDLDGAAMQITSEGTTQFDDNTLSVAYAEEGESLVSADGKYWYDISREEGHNLRIKGFTKEIDPSGGVDDYLTFSSETTFSISLPKLWDGKLYYSTDSSAWNEWDGSEIEAALNTADGKYCLYLCGTGNTFITGDQSEEGFTIDGSNVSCSGNIETLLDYYKVASGIHPEMSSYCYYNLFYNCTALTSAPELPAPTLTSGCYFTMFFGCTNLTAAPVLPATTLADYCCYAMFWRCANLTAAPALPAAALADYCYYHMFSDCTSLTAAPALSAAALAKGCYYEMFSGCTSLTSVPALPAAALADSCYHGMFSGCTGIKLSESGSGEPWSIPAGATAATDWNKDMFSGTGGSFTGDPEIGKTYYCRRSPSGKCGEHLTWTLDEDGTLTISGTGAMYDYASISDRPWDMWGYVGDMAIKTVRINSGVTTIGDNAFNNCSGLAEITIADSVVSVGKTAFYHSSYPYSVTIGKGVASIGDSAFNGAKTICVSEENQYFTTQDNILFSKDKSVLIQYPIGKEGPYSVPDSVTTIGNYAFFSWGYQPLSEVMIPESVTTIGRCAFDQCFWLTEINVAEQNPNYSSEDGVLFNKDKSVLIQYPGGIMGESYIIPSSVAVIGECAFHNSGITSVTIPKSVTEIRQAAFSYCYNLTDACYDGTEAQWQEISIGSNNEYLTGAAIHYQSAATLTLPASLKKIEAEAFEGITAEVIVVPATVTEIGSKAFANCPNLRKVIFRSDPDNINIADDFLDGCEGVEAIKP